MPSPTEITVQQLSRLIGLPSGPVVVDVRDDDDYGADPRMIPGSHRRDYRSAANWVGAYKGKSVVVACQKGLKLSQGTAAWLRHEGVEAQSLEGGNLAWRDAGHMLVPAAKLPPRDAQGRTVWVTRARPKIDRIACPWLIRRFIDRDAEFHFVEPAWVTAVAQDLGAIPYDIDGVEMSHDGPLCSFDTLIAKFGIVDPALARVQMLVRGADTARLDLAP